MYVYEPVRATVVRYLDIDVSVTPINATLKDFLFHEMITIAQTNLSSFNVESVEKI